MNRKTAAAVSFATVLPTVVTLVYFVWLKDFSPGVKQFAYAVGKTLQFSFPLLFVWFFDRAFFRRRSASDDRSGVSDNRLSAGPGYVIGAAFGLIVALAIPAIYYLFIQDSSIAAGLLSRVEEKTIGNGIDSASKFIALGVFYAVCHSFLEEYYWRWFVFGQMKKLSTPVIANIISSLGFMAHHVVLLAVFFESWTSPLTWLFSFAVCIGGVFWAWLYQRTGKLKTVWLSHLLVDAGIFFLGYLLLKSLL